MSEIKNSFIEIDAESLVNICSYNIDYIDKIRNNEKEKCKKLVIEKFRKRLNSWIGIFYPKKIKNMSDGELFNFLLNIHGLFNFYGNNVGMNEIEDYLFKSMYYWRVYEASEDMLKIAKHHSVGKIYISVEDFNKLNLDKEE